MPINHRVDRVVFPMKPKHRVGRGPEGNRPVLTSVEICSLFSQTGVTLLRQEAETQMIQSGELQRHSFGIKECEPFLGLKLETPEMKAFK